MVKAFSKRKKEVEQGTDPIEGEVCLYKDGEAKNFTQADAQDALSDGWKDNPTDGAKKKRGRPAKEEEA